MRERLPLKMPTRSLDDDSDSETYWDEMELRAEILHERWLEQREQEVHDDR